jgi:formylglycine-generating enzyme required for sulfatase activity
MIGNVWEWTAGLLERDYTGAPDDGRAWLRGRLWSAGGARRLLGRHSGARAGGLPLRIVPGDRNSNLGFRLARTL